MEKGTGKQRTDWHAGFAGGLEIGLKDYLGQIEIEREDDDFRALRIMVHNASEEDVRRFIEDSGGYDTPGMREYLHALTVTTQSNLVNEMETTTTYNAALKENTGLTSEKTSEAGHPASDFYFQATSKRVRLYY